VCPPLQVLAKVSSGEVHYRGIQFYLAQHTNLLVDVLTVLQPRLDAARVIAIFRKADKLQLVKDYLLAVQKNNITEVGAGAA
jgi:clathrin heavy chain